ncbi:MAG: T9SS type A sorting domain-containing protein [Bacteroidetes bacterium]|nr:T9SS type A sorting domain-containing protein [Bacteroidota bacterium]
MKQILIFVFYFVFFSVIGFSQPINLDFSSGAINGWTLQEGGNQNSITKSIYNLHPSTEYSIMSYTNEINGVVAGISSPLGGNYIRVGSMDTGGVAYKLSQTFTVDVTSKALLFSYTFLMDNGGHDCSEQNYFDFCLTDASGNKIPSYSDNHYILNSINCSGGDPNYAATGFTCKYWKNVSYDLTNYIGATVTIDLYVSGCNMNQGEHAGYAYFDAAICNNNNLSPSYLTINDSIYPILESNSMINLCGLDTAVIWGPVGATNFSWAGGAINGLTTQSVSITQPGVYNLVCNKPFGCSNNINASFAIGAVPVLTVTGTSPNCPDVVINLTGSGAQTYTWMPIAGTPQAMGFTNQYSVLPRTTSVYKLLGKNAFGCVGSLDYTVTPLPSPTITVTGNNSLCSGNTTLTATGADTYTWSTGVTTNSIVVTPSVTMVYTVSGSSASYSCLDTYIDTIRFLGVGINSSSLKMCQGGSVTVLGKGATSYTWSNGATTNSVVLSPTVTTTYTVFGLSAGSCGVTQSVFTVTVNPLPNVYANSLPNTPTVCTGATMYLYGSGSATTYSWSGGVTNNVSFNPTVSSTYTVTGTDVNGCVNTATRSISVYTYTVDVNPPYPLCSGQSATLTVLGASTYTWFNSSTSQSIVVSPTVNTSYNVTASNSVCTMNIYKQVQVANSPPSFYTWASSYTICSANASTPSIYLTGTNCYYSCSQPDTKVPNVTSGYFVVNPLPPSPTVYTITATNGCGVISNTILITPIVSPTVTISGPTVSCSGSLVTYTANGATSYSWTSGGNTANFSSSPTTNQIYTVTGASATGGCTSSVSISLAVLKSPTVTANNPNICIGNSAILNASGASTYTWNTGSNSYSINVSPASSTNYTVYGTGSNGCVSSYISTVTVASLTSPISVNSGTVCEGNFFIMSPTGASSYTYSSGSASVAPTVNSTYTVTGLNSYGCIMGSAISSVTVFPAPTIVVNSGSVCVGQSFVMNPSGGNVYVYSNGSNNVFPTTTNNTFTVSGSDINGCINTAVSNVNIVAPTISVGNGTVCLGSSFTAIPSGANTYTWSTGAIASSIAVTPTINTTYTVTGTDLSNCVGSQTVSVMIDNTCQDVWPGDANSDGVTNNLDVLELGLHFTQTGFPRPIISNAWQPYRATNWSGNITGGKNLNHSDCNGDGIINNDDTLAIYNNYGLTHAFKPAQEEVITPQLSVVPDQVAVLKGTWGTASIYLGNLDESINNINGVAFTVDFDYTLIEANNIYIEYQNSFLDAGQNLHFRKMDFVTGKIFTATTHTVNNNVYGYGKIATLYYQIKSTLTSAQVLNITISQANKSDDLGVITPLTTGAGSLTATIDVGLQEILNKSFVMIHPNPTNGVLTVMSKTEVEKIEIVAITGQVLLSETSTNASFILHLENLSNGIYFVNVYQNNRIVKREKIVLNK